jgi:hypothetical protein
LEVEGRKEAASVCAGSWVLEVEGRKDTTLELVMLGVELDW